MDGDVADLDPALVAVVGRPGGLGAVVEHDVAERAGGGDAGGARRQGLLGPLVVDLDARRLLHPHAGAAGAAAHALGAVAGHLDDLDPLDRADDLAGRDVHVVVPTEVARVVVRDALLQRRLADVELAALDQRLQQLGVVHDLVVAAELRVLVVQRVEAVRALRDDLLHAHAVEHLDVRHGQHLEQVLVARPAGRVAGAHLRRSEHGDGDPGPAQQLGHRLGDPLVLVVEAAGAADPVEVLGLQRLTRVDDLHVVHVLGPVAPVALAHAPRVALVLHAAVGVAELGREVRLHQRQVAPHVEDLVEDLDVDRADLVARLAARAGPQLLGRDALEHRVGADRDLRDRCRWAATRSGCRWPPSPRRP